MNVVADLANFTLAFLFWLLIGRFALDAITRGRRTFVSEMFWRGTDPILRATRAVTPAFVSTRFVPVIALLLLIVLRIPLRPFLTP